MNKTYDKITQVFIDALSEGKIPWHRSWKSCDAMPKNLYSKKEYRGINVLVLGMTGEEWFVTYRQAQMLGGTVVKGAKGLPVVYWNWTEKKNKETGKVEKKIPFLRYSTVFPVSMTDGLRDRIPETEKAERTHTPVEDAEMVLKRNVHERAVGNPSYCPGDDTIRMPDAGSFDSAEHYYTVYFHELTHWTGSQKRLKRDLSTLFGSHKYSKEELVAEIGANFLASECGIDLNVTMENSKAYIQSWIRELKNDPRLIIEASTQARKATDYLMERENAYAHRKDKTEKAA